MSEDRVLVCQRRSLLNPHVKSEEWDCGVCGHPIWIAKSSPRAKYYWCSVCAAERITEETKIEPVTEKQLADLAAYFNKR